VATVLIKKYGNRRLYDTGDSRYVTLEELAAKIRAGHDLRVVDAQTGEDLTQATLTQIVLETGNAAKFLPVQLLTQMIRLSDDALAEFFSRYVTGALDLYLQAKRGVQTLATYNPLTQLPIAATDALARMWMGSPFVPTYQAPPPPPAPVPVVEPEPEAAPRTDDVAAMRRELEELKQAVREGLGPRRKKRKP
jgi:polyhydroxyalkanoate synthesis repressor PhaR